jgi:hypothetical protein
MDRQAFDGESLSARVLGAFMNITLNILPRGIVVAKKEHSDGLGNRGEILADSRLHPRRSVAFAHAQGDAQFIGERSN